MNGTRLERLRFDPRRGTGRLVTIDGLDGCGKTTITEGLARRLTDRGLCVVVTRIPTTEMRESRFFELLQRQGRTDLVDPLAFEVAYMVDRIQHCRTFIEPALEKGCYVIVDRYAFSSIGSLLLRIPELHEVAIGAVTKDAWFRDLCRYLVQPDLSFLLHADPRTAIDRLVARPEEFDRHVDANEYGRLQGFLLELAKANDMVTIDTGRSCEDTLSECLAFVEPLLPKRDGAWRA